MESLVRTFNKFRKSAKKLWSSSKYFRVLSLSIGSVFSGLMLRNLYLRMYRKYYNLPNGMFGIPLIGQALQIFDPDFLVKFATNYGCIGSILFGPYNAVLINEPYLVKKIYSDPRTLNTFATEMGDTKQSEMAFALINGKNWSQRRKIIYSNLMSTMKASYVEDATKKFVKTKIFAVFDKNIKNNKTTSMKSLFRPIGFNIVSQACFGKELSSLNDPFWFKWNKKSTERLKNAPIQLIIIALFEKRSKRLSLYLQHLLTGNDVMSEFAELIDILDDFTKNKSRDIDILLDEDSKNNQDIKLFNDYIEDYINESDETKSKFTRRHLLGDMMMMFFAATDTTYSTLSFALLLAAKYPNIQETLYEEISDAFNNDVDEIELKNKGILKVPRLRAFVHETLRIFPPAPIAGVRQILDDGFTVNTMGFGDDKIYNIPKKSVIMTNVCSIGQNAKYWIKDYDPMNNVKHKNVNMKEVHFEFWMDDDGHFSKKKNSSSFFSFSYGKRDCVGQALAMKELIIVLSMIFIKYKVLSCDGKTDFKINTVFGGELNEPEMDNIRLQLRHKKIE